MQALKLLIQTTNTFNRAHALLTALWRAFVVVACHPPAPALTLQNTTIKTTKTTLWPIHPEDYAMHFIVKVILLQLTVATIGTMRAIIIATAVITIIKTVNRW